MGERGDFMRVKEEEDIAFHRSESRPVRGVFIAVSLKYVS